jgi:hypothetical protein
VSAPAMLRFRMQFPARGCARIRARGFTRFDALTIASVLPGVADDYPDTSSPMECDTPQPDTNYVRSLPRKYVKNPYLPLFWPKPPPGKTPKLKHRIC